MVVFLTIMGIGFCVLLISLVLGEVFEHGADLAHDVAIEHEVLDHGGDVDHAEGGPSIFSVRIISSFITGFGGAGAIGVHLGFSYLVSSLFGLVGGFLVAVPVFFIVKFLMKQQASSNLTVSDLEGKTALVSVSIPENGAGQITLTTHGRTVYQTARSSTGRAIPHNSVVTIRQVVADFVVVD